MRSTVYSTLLCIGAAVQRGFIFRTRTTIPNEGGEQYSDLVEKNFKKSLNTPDTEIVTTIQVHYH